MKLHHLRTPLRFAALAGACASMTACALFAPKPVDRPVVAAVQEKDAPAGDTPVTPPVAAPVSPPAAAPVLSTVSELQALIQARQVTELRTIYNGSYGASLLFKVDDMTYFVTLFQQKNFWRVVRTTSERQAEATFRSFSQESSELAEVEMRRIKLQADYELSERLLSRRTEQLSILEADQAIRQQQAQEVVQRQAQTRSQAAELAKQQDDAKRELRELQKRIDALQAEQTRLGNSVTATKKSGGR